MRFIDLFEFFFKDEERHTNNNIAPTTVQQPELDTHDFDYDDARLFGNADDQDGFWGDDYDDELFE